MTFQEQSSVCVLRSLQQKTTPQVGCPKKYVLPDNANFYPIQSQLLTLDSFQDLVERDLTILHIKEKEQGVTKHKNLNFVEQKVLKD